MEIKIKESSKDIVKTIDRAGLMAGSFKDISMRTRDDLVNIFDQNEGSHEYAPGVMGDAVSEGSSYAMRAGADAVHHIKGGGGSAGSPGDGAGAGAPGIEPVKNVNAEPEHRVISDYGRKRIVDRRERVRIGREEAATRNTGSGQRYTAKTAKNRHNAPDTSGLMLQRKKEYAIKRHREKNMISGGFWRSGVKNSGRQGEKAVVRIGRLIKDAAAGVKAMFSSLTIGGAATLVIVIIMVIFGAAFAFNEDGSYMEGSGDATIVEVARGELGNVGGDKFWKWYGFKSHVDWCAIFVSWCANQCGYIEMGIIPRFAVVGDGASWFKARHRWAGRGYKPKPGDIIFFDYEQDGLLDHVGIVESCDGKTVTTIEGNSGNACKRNSYSVGNSQIAGYGLTLIPGGGNNAQKIARKATQLAYPDSPKEAKYHGGKPTAAYAAALNRAYPNRSGWGKPPRDGASCDVFVGVCVVDSGVDKDFPRGYRDQAIRLDSRKDLYECIASITSGSIPESMLKDGDIIRYDKSNGGCHICIYVGGKIKQAGYDNFYPRTNSVGSKLNIKGKKLIRVYRVKG